MPNYSTQVNVRQRAGFAGNFDVSTFSITTSMATADNIFDAAVFDVYSLPLSETPSLASEIVTNLAVGQILIDNYGVQDEDGKKNGQNHLDFANDLLDQIRKRKLKLLDSASNELNTSTTNLPQFYPNNTSYDSSTDSTAPQVWMNQKF